MASVRPFAAAPLAEGLAPADCVRAFLQTFGTDLRRAVLWQDQTGTYLPISDGFFRDRAGMWKVGKRGREVFTPLMAEALMDPDEIWLGVASKTNLINPESEELAIDRQCIRVDPDTGMVVVMEIGRKWSEPVTAYNPTAKSGNPDLRLLDRRRGGKLLWKRNDGRGDPTVALMTYQDPSPVSRRQHW